MFSAVKWASSVWMIVGAVAASALVFAQQSQAQQREAAIWEVPLGTPASAVPPEFMITACGTNGGPPSTPLRGFEEYQLCAPEPETGLHEVWFSYNDEREYYLRAIRANPEVIEDNRANTLLGQLVVYSLLFDSEGRVQGHRISSDTREDPEVRVNSDQLDALKVFAYGADGWNCTDLPPEEGELPFGGLFLKRICEKVDDQGRYVTIRTHHFLRPGQRAGRPGAPLPNEFEAGAWIEAINAEIVGRAN